MELIKSDEEGEVKCSGVIYWPQTNMEKIQKAEQKYFDSILFDKSEEAIKTRFINWVNSWHNFFFENAAWINASNGLWMFENVDWNGEKIEIRGCFQNNSDAANCVYLNVFKVSVPKRKVEFDVRTSEITGLDDLIRKIINEKKRKREEWNNPDGVGDVFLAESDKAKDFLGAAEKKKLVISLVDMCLLISIVGFVLAVWNFFK